MAHTCHLRGVQVVNVSRGGTLVTDMDVPHREVVSELAVREPSRLRETSQAHTLWISCYHHQMLRALGARLQATA